MSVPSDSVQADLDRTEDGGESAGRAVVYNRSRDGRLVKTHIVNVLLIVLTLTLYRFWAVTRVRRMVWANTRFDGEPFEYTGNGLEIFLGFLKVFAFVLLPLGILAAIVDATIGLPTTTEELAALELYGWLQIWLVLWLFEMGRFLSWRYRLSRTRWRGIRGRIDASVWRYSGIALLTVAAWLITGGLLKPIADAMRAKFALSRMSLGTLKVDYFGGDVILFGRWIVVMLASGAIVTVATLTSFGYTVDLSSIDTADPVAVAAATDFVGRLTVALAIAGLLIMWLYFWYRAGFWRYVAAHARLGGLSFSFRASGTQMFGLWLGNLLILVLSLSLLAPLTWRRKIEFLGRHLEIRGSLDTDAIRQAAEDDGAAGGEGLVGDFDIA